MVPQSVAVGFNCHYTVICYQSGLLVILAGALPKKPSGCDSKFSKIYQNHKTSHWSHCVFSKGTLRLRLVISHSEPHLKVSCDNVSMKIKKFKKLITCYINLHWTLKEFTLFYITYHTHQYRSQNSFCWRDWGRNVGFNHGLRKARRLQGPT